MWQIALAYGAIFLNCLAASHSPQATVDREAVAFVQDVLAQRPARPLTVEGVLHLRSADGRRNQIPMRYLVRLE